MQRRNSCRWLGRALGGIIAAGLMLAGPDLVSAGFCGDDLDGQRVPCACGDTVVSDTTLSAIDPVAVLPCRGDGLRIAAPHDAESIRIDLAGLSLVGSGEGTGLRVLRGGTEGARILGGSADSPAEVVGFRRGFLAHGLHTVSELRDIDFRANLFDGVRMRASNAVVRDVTATENGRDGFRLRGRSSSYVDLDAAQNGRTGLHLTGSKADLSAVASDNGLIGVFVSGRGHLLRDVDASGNQSAGVFLTGREHRSINLDCRDNQGSDLGGFPRALSLGGAQ